MTPWARQRLLALRCFLLRHLRRNSFRVRSCQKPKKPLKDFFESKLFKQTDWYTFRFHVLLGWFGLGSLIIDEPVVYHRHAYNNYQWLTVTTRVGSIGNHQPSKIVSMSSEPTTNNSSSWLTICEYHHQRQFQVLTFCTCEDDGVDAAWPPSAPG